MALRTAARLPFSKSHTAAHRGIQGSNPVTTGRDGQRGAIFRGLGALHGPSNRHGALATRAKHQLRAPLRKMAKYTWPMVCTSVERHTLR
ncbi:hypothetical protein V5799_030799 [Amblyomma americanum]|uniref:Uncharacterized protein n=1 Tax=Amblyomma americanum TaxID=6943 RepID=A0AAQ4EM21_AMBAM